MRRAEILIDESQMERHLTALRQHIGAVDGVAGHDPDRGGDRTGENAGQAALGEMKIMSELHIDDDEQFARRKPEVAGARLQGVRRDIELRAGRLACLLYTSPSPRD